jgi:hypothetical protein
MSYSMTKIIEAMPGQIAVKDSTIERPEQLILGQLFSRHDTLVAAAGGNFRPDVLMPYSFSTFAAASVAGCFSRAKALEYASVRADLVRATESRKPESERTAMAIVVGNGEYATDLANKFGVDWTNNNFSVHVLSGKVRDLTEMAKAAGARFRGMLTAEGAYHCDEREEDSIHFATFLSGERFEDPKIPIISSTEPRLLQTGEDVKVELSALMRRRVVLEEILRGVASYIRGEVAARLEILSDHLIVDISPESTIKKLTSRLPVKLNVIDLNTDGLASMLGIRQISPAAG